MSVRQRDAKFLDALKNLRPLDTFLVKNKSKLNQRKLKDFKAFVRLLAEAGNRLEERDDGSGRHDLIGRAKEIKRSGAFKKVKEWIEANQDALVVDGVGFSDYYAQQVQDLEATRRRRRIEEVARRKTEAEGGRKQVSEEKVKSRMEEKKEEQLRSERTEKQSVKVQEAKALLATVEQESTLQQLAVAQSELAELLEKGAEESLAEVRVEPEVPIPQTDPAVEDPQAISGPFVETETVEEQKQLEANVNQSATAITEAVLVQQSEESERVLDQSNQIDELKDVDPDPIDFFAGQPSEVAITLRLDTPAGEPESEEPEGSKDLSERLEKLKDLSERLTAITEGRQSSTQSIDEIIDLQDELGPLSARNVSTATGIQSDINKVIRSIQRKLRLPAVISILDARRRETRLTVIQEETKELVAELTRTREAILSIKDQLDNDDLLVGRIIDPSPGSELVKDALDEMSDMLERDRGVVQQSIIDSFVRIFDIVSFDTQQVIVDVLRNTITEVDIGSIGLIPSRIMSRTLMRFVARLIYANSSFSMIQREQNINAFLETGFTISGRDQSVVERLLSALRLVIPEPEPVPEVKVVDLTSTIVAQERRRQKQERKRSRRLERGERRRELDRLRGEALGDARGAFQSGSLFGFRASRVSRAFTAFRDRVAEAIRDTNPFLREETKVTDDELKEFEEDFDDLEQGVFTQAAQAAAIQALAEAKTGEELELFGGLFGEMSAAAVKNIPGGEDLAADAIDAVAARDPNLLGDAARGLAREVLPVFRQRPNLQNIPRPLLIGAIVSSIMAGIYGIASHFYSEETPDQEAPTPAPVTLPVKKTKDPLEEPGETGAIGRPLLRPDFYMLGTDYFDRQFALTPLDVQNSEWAEFDFVKIDRQNNIVKDNMFGNSVRFREPMFLPNYQAPVAAPSKQAVIMGRDSMMNAIQITQQFAPKFSGAVSVYDNLSQTYNRDAFSRSWQDVALFHPDGSIA